MLSRRRLLPWLQTSFRRGGQGPNPFILLALIATACVISLFARNSTEQGDQNSSALQAMKEERPKIQFVAVDAAVAVSNEKRNKKALFILEPYVDNINRVFDEKATKTPVESQKLEQEGREERNTQSSFISGQSKALRDQVVSDDNYDDDFVNVGEEFVPPSNSMQIIQGIGSLIQNSLQFLQKNTQGSPLLEFAGNVAPLLSISFGSSVNGGEQSNSAVSALAQAIPLLLSQGSSNQKEVAGPANGIGSLLSFAKIFLDTNKESRVRKESQYRNKETNSNLDQKNLNIKNKKFTGFHAEVNGGKKLDSGLKAESREISRIPLSVQGIRKGPATQDDGNMESKEKDHNFTYVKRTSVPFDVSQSLSKLISISARSFLPKVIGETADATGGQIQNHPNSFKIEGPSSIAGWMRKLLDDPGRTKSSEDIKNIYAVLMRVSQKFSQDPCSKVVHYAKLEHGWKADNFKGTQFVCEDSDFELAFKQSCHIYSFGIGDDWSFEEKMQRKGCKIWAFDVAAEKPKYLDSSIHLFNVGLGPKNEEKIIDGKRVQFHTLKNIIEKLNHSAKNINYLKININGDEWPVLEQILNETPDILNNFLQLGLKTHLHTAMLDHSLYGQYFKLLNQLPSFGFQPFASTRVYDNPNDVYEEPLMDNKPVSLTNYVAYYKL